MPKNINIIFGDNNSGKTVYLIEKLNNEKNFKFTNLESDNGSISNEKYTNNRALKNENAGSKFTDTSRMVDSFIDEFGLTSDENPKPKDFENLLIIFFANVLENKWKKILNIDNFLHYVFDIYNFVPCGYFGRLFNIYLDEIGYKSKIEAVIYKYILYMKKVGIDVSTKNDICVSGNKCHINSLSKGAINCYNLYKYCFLELFQSLEILKNDKKIVLILDEPDMRWDPNSIKTFIEMILDLPKNIYFYISTHRYETLKFFDGKATFYLKKNGHEPIKKSCHYLCTMHDSALYLNNYNMKILVEGLDDYNFYKNVLGDKVLCNTFLLNRYNHPNIKNIKINIYPVGGKGSIVKDVNDVIALYNDTDIKNFLYIIIDDDNETQTGDNTYNNNKKPPPACNKIYKSPNFRDIDNIVFDAFYLSMYKECTNKILEGCTNIKFKKVKFTGPNEKIYNSLYSELLDALNKNNTYNIINDIFSKIVECDKNECSDVQKSLRLYYTLIFCAVSKNGNCSDFSFNTEEILLKYIHTESDKYLEYFVPAFYLKTKIKNIDYPGFDGLRSSLRNHNKRVYVNSYVYDDVLVKLYNGFTKDFFEII